MPDDFARFWPLDRSVTFLNHGSFGACPTVVLRHQAALRAEMEAEPVRFLSREVFGRLDEARAALAAFVGADAEDLAFVTNATSGVNAVLRSLRFNPGDELVTTDHAYRACRNAIDFVAERSGAHVVIAPVPFPLASSAEVVTAVLERVTRRTRLALLDHVTSPTGLVMPVGPLVAELSRRGVQTLVDGAHAPGMVPLDVAALGADYYSGNCHKWLCSPKGAGFLHVRRDRRDEIRPLTISHGATASYPGRSRFRLEFDWTGTADPTAWLSVPKAIEHVGSLLDGGWPALMARNHRLALDARRGLCEAVGALPPCPDDMIGSLASIPLPDGATTDIGWRQPDEIQAQLYESFGIEVPVHSWPAAPKRLVRISCALYNTLPEYERLAQALTKVLR